MYACTKACTVNTILFLNKERERERERERECVCVVVATYLRMYVLGISKLPLTILH